MNIQHSSRSDLWYTPISIIELVKGVLEHIDLDPASDEFGNSRVQAARYFSREDSGLEQEWGGSIYCNPPGGKLNNKSLSALFWQKMMRTRESKSFKHAIWMCFSAESAAITQRKGVPSILAFPICVPASRLKFDGPDGVRGKSPSHSNIIVYIPGIVNKTKEFVSMFQCLGDCKV